MADYITSTAGMTPSANQPAGSKADEAGNALSKDFNNFLLLLTTQLKNQDPTEPMDTNAMTQQLATFASVEQQISTNKHMEKLVELYSGSQMDKMVGYIGKNVEGEGGMSELTNGTAYFSYEVPANVSQAIVSVVDINGRVVFSADGDNESGRHGLVWNGTNSFSGAKMGDGVYRLLVNAFDANGEPIEGAKAFTNGRVTAVESSGTGGEAVLKLGNISLPISSVTTIRDVPTTTTPPTETGGNTQTGAAA